MRRWRESATKEMACGWARQRLHHLFGATGAAGKGSPLIGPSADTRALLNVTAVMLGGAVEPTAAAEIAAEIMAALGPFVKAEVHTCLTSATYAADPPALTSGLSALGAPAGTKEMIDPRLLCATVHSATWAVLQHHGPNHLGLWLKCRQHPDHCRSQSTQQMSTTTQHKGPNRLGLWLKCRQHPDLQSRRAELGGLGDDGTPPGPDHAAGPPAIEPQSEVIRAIMVEDSPCWRHPQRWH